MIQIGTKPKKKSFIESESSEYFRYFICLCSLNELKFIQNTIFIQKGNIPIMIEVKQGIEYFVSFLYLKVSVFL